MCLVMIPELTPHRFPCVRCGKMRRLSVSDQLCWIAQPADHRNDDSCHRAFTRAVQDDRIQDVIRHKLKKGAA